MRDNLQPAPVGAELGKRLLRLAALLLLVAFLLPLAIQGYRLLKALLN